MSNAETGDSRPVREIGNANLFADDISFSDTEKILFTEDLQEEDLEQHRHLMDGNPAERYTLIRKLNEGGMKSIWEVDDHRTARKVAMALIQESRIASERDIEAFLYEARLTANLQHPNIVPIYDIALDENGNPYFTMKVLKGETLGDILKKKREGDSTFTRTRLLGIFLRVCHAISYAHTKGVLHLDLKPSNVIVGEFGDVHVLDWGLSTLMTHLPEGPVGGAAAHWHDEEHAPLESGQTLTRYLETTADDRRKRNLIGGTPGYMAPEQAKATPEDIDFRTDIYMLGAILYEILTLHHCVEGQSVKEVLKKTVEGRIEPPAFYDRSVPYGLAAISMKALSGNKEERYASVEALLRDLHQYQDGFATQAENPTFWTHLTLLVKRHKRPVGLILLFTLLIVVIVALSMRSIRLRELEAVAARTVAQERLVRLQEQDTYIRETARQVAPDYFQLFMTEEGRFAFAKAEQMLLTSLAFDGQLEPARRQRAAMLICQERFSEARPLLSLDDPLYRVADRPDRPLADSELESFMQAVRQQAPQSMPRLFYHFNRSARADAEAWLELLRRQLMLVNPYAGEIRWTISPSPEGWQIDLSGNRGLDDLTPLCGLKMRSLDVGGALAPDLRLLRASGLRELSVADTELTHLNLVGDLLALEELDISGTHVRNMGDIIGLSSLSRLSMRGLDLQQLVDQYPYMRSLRLLTVAKEERGNPILQRMTADGIIVIFR
jgi:serine/threonine protein kinase